MAIDQDYLLGISLLGAAMAIAGGESDQPPDDGGDGPDDDPDDGGDDPDDGGGSDPDPDPEPEYRYTETDAQYVARSRSALHSALDEAGNGDVIWVPGDAEIDAGGSTFRVPGGVTIASDREKTGLGGAIAEDNDNSNVRMIVTEGSDVTLYGLRIRGPIHRTGNAGGDGWDHAHIGARFKASGEVAHCEVFGWGYAAIDAPAAVHVHDSNLYNNAQNNLGYAVQCRGGHSVIERNEFGYNRHCIAGQGSAGYTARQNVVGADQHSHAFDHHGTGGDVEIHNNRFEMPAGNHHASSAYRQREPAHNAEMHHNWCFHDSGVNSPEQKSIGDAVWYIAGGNYSIHDNHYGTTSPPDGVGVTQ